MDAVTLNDELPDFGAMAAAIDVMRAERDRALAEAALVRLELAIHNDLGDSSIPDPAPLAAAAARVLAVAERIDALRDGPGYKVVDSPELSALLNELEEGIVVLKANRRGDSILPWTGDERANR